MVNRQHPTLTNSAVLGIRHAHRQARGGLLYHAQANAVDGTTHHAINGSKSQHCYPA